MKKLISCVLGIFGALSAMAVALPGLMQYRLSGVSSGKFVTPDEWTSYRDDSAITPVVTPGALMGKKANVNGTTWNGVTYPFTNTTGYWYEGYMYLEAGMTYSGYSRFDDGGCIYLDGVELYNQGTSSGYSKDTTRTCYTYTPTQTGWYKVQLGIWDWGSNRSCQNSTIAAVQWSTNEPPVATGSGTASLWKEFWDADTDDALVGNGELFYSEDPNYVGIDGAPTAAFSGDDIIVTAKTVSPFYSGKVYAIFGPSYPFAYTNLLGTVAKGSQTISGALTGVPEDVICHFGVYAESDADATKVQESLGETSFLNGDVTVSASSASTMDAPVTLTFARPATATDGDLLVTYSVGGSGVPGTDYDALPSSITISDGAATASVSIYPHFASSDHTVTVTVTPQNYLTDSATATATVTLRHFAAKKQITFTASGYAGTETLTNFPVLVRVSTNTVAGFNYADLKRSDGADLRFVSEQGTILPYEIQKWDTDGTSLIWVRIPELTATAKFVAYYGGTSEAYSSSASTWSDRYLGVWHLDTVTNGATADSTGHGLTATNRYPTSDASIVSTSGVLCGSVNNTQAKGFLSPAFTNIFCGSKFAVSAWFYHPSKSVGGNARHLSTKTAWNAAVGFELDTSSSGTSSLTLTTSGQSRIYPPCTPANGYTAWQKYTLVFDDAKFTFYTNGVATMVEQSFTKPVHGDTGFAIGNNAKLSESVVQGCIDEVRFAMFAESADWAKAEYDTETSETFVTNTGVQKLVRPGLLLMVR